MATQKKAAAKKSGTTKKAAEPTTKNKMPAKTVKEPVRKIPSSAMG